MNKTQKVKKFKNFSIFSSKLRFIDATVFKQGFLDSGFNQKSNGTRIFSPAVKERELSLIKLQTIFLLQTRFLKPLPRKLFKNIFWDLNTNR